MSSIEESKAPEEKKPAARRSSLKASDSGSKLDPQNLLKIKGKRHSVSFGQSNTFQFKAMKAMFKESNDINQPIKETEEKHKKFMETRRKSTKDEFSLVREMLKKNQNIIEEEQEEEVKTNTNKNIKIGKKALEEESESSDSEGQKSN